MSGVRIRTSTAKISAVIPVYGCAPCLTELHRRLTRILESLTDRYEVIFVDDCSPDEAWEVITTLASQDENVVGYQLTRRFGQVSAIAAGVARAGGEWVLTLDCDLQDDPREIPRIYETGRSGHDVVLYLLEQREQPLWRWAGGKIHGALLGWVTKSPLAGRHGNFCMVRRSVVQRFLASPQVGFMYSSALVRLARNLGTVQGTRRSRYEGRSSYSVSALVATSLRNLAGYWERFVRLYLLPPAALVAVGFVVYVFLPLPRSDPTRSVILAVLSMMLFVDLTAGCLVYGLYRRLRCCPFAVARSVRSSRVTEDEG